MVRTAGYWTRISLAGALALSLGACDFINSQEAQDKASGAAPAAGGEAGETAGAPALDPNLANPQVGDVWAASLDHFSAAEFTFPEGQDTGQEAFGLLQVVDVTEQEVTVITEQGATPDRQAAISRLSSYQGNVQWDPQERIPIRRADFATLVRDGRILQTQRGSSGDATSGSNASDYSAGSGNSNAGDYSAGNSGPAAGAPPAQQQGRGGK